MPTGLTSLAGYGSDSDDEPTAAPAAPAAAPVATSSASSRLSSLLPPPKSTLASKLPTPSHAPGGTRSGGSSLSLPPPSASASVAKRKVIKVDSLASLDDDDDDDLDPAEEKRHDAQRPKKARLGLASAAAGSSSKHSLFGMLPAPKRKDDEVLAERKREAQARKAEKLKEQSDSAPASEMALQVQEVFAVSPSPDTPVGQAAATSADPSDGGGSKPKGKNNDAFRAMLGLKPTAKPPATARPPQDPPQSRAPASISLTKTEPAQPKQQSARPDPTPSTARIEPAPLDFFSLNTDASARSSATNSHEAPLTISAAPSIEQSSEPQDAEAASASEEYPGWQLEPDGSWVPVTPEAHAQLLAYEQSLSTPSATVTSKGAGNLDGTRDLLAAGLTPEDIRSFDAAAAARDAARPGADDDADTDKYAAAAEFAAGNRDAMTQRKPGMLKGLRKGQLSSLVNLANENRSKMEQKWQRSRDGKAKRANQYGF